MYEIGEICFGGYLCVVSMWDIRKREIPVWLIAAGGILSASLGYFHGKIPLVLMVTGALVGGVFLLISRLTQEAFGYGDSLMIAVTGVSRILECVVSPCLGICSGSSVCRIRADQERFSKRCGISVCSVFTGCVYRDRLSGRDINEVCKGEYHS